MNKSEILETLLQYKKDKSQTMQLEELGIFGSFARGDNSENSDIDIFIKTTTANPFMIVHMKDEIESLLRMNVDIVRLRDTMNPYLKKKIAEEGIYV